MKAHDASWMGGEVHLGNRVAEAYEVVTFDELTGFGPSKRGCEWGIDFDDCHIGSEGVADHATRADLARSASHYGVRVERYDVSGSDQVVSVDDEG